MHLATCGIFVQSKPVLPEKWNQMQHKLSPDQSNLKTDQTGSLQNTNLLVKNFKIFWFGDRIEIFLASIFKLYKLTTNVFSYLKISTQNLVNNTFNPAEFFRLSTCVYQVLNKFQTFLPIQRLLDQRQDGTSYRACLKRRHVYEAVWPSGRVAEINFG